MANTVQKNNKGRLGSIVAGVASAVAVAGVAVAATIALKDKKTREKVKKSLEGIKDRAINYVESLEKKPETKKIISNTKKSSKKIIKVTKKAKKVTK